MNLIDDYIVYFYQAYCFCKLKTWNTCDGIAITFNDLTWLN